MSNVKRHGLNRLMNRFPSLDLAVPRTPQAIAKQGSVFNAQMAREERLSNVDQLDRARARQQAARDAKNNG